MIKEKENTYLFSEVSFIQGLFWKHWPDSKAALIAHMRKIVTSQVVLRKQWTEKNNYHWQAYDKEF